MFLKLYLISLPILIGIDMLWLGLVAKNFYFKQIGFLMTSDVIWLAALIFYMLYAIGIVVFVVIPAVRANSLSHALLYGALFGLIAYATYDLTNLATLKNWPVLFTFIDLIWGSVLSSAVATITLLIGRSFFV